MSESLKPVGEDFSSSIEDLADFSGEVAMEIYQTQLEKGSNASSAFSAAIEGATGVMMDSGCPKEICDVLASAAINGFNAYMKDHPNGDPMEAFNAAGESINNALEFEFSSNNN